MHTTNTNNIFPLESPNSFLGVKTVTRTCLCMDVDYYWLKSERWTVPLRISFCPIRQPSNIKYNDAIIFYRHCPWLIARETYIKYNNYTLISFLPHLLFLLCLGKCSDVCSTCLPLLPLDASFSMYAACYLRRVRNSQSCHTSRIRRQSKCWGVCVQGAKSWTQMFPPYLRTRTFHGL